MQPSPQRTSEEPARVISFPDAGRAAVRLYLRLGKRFAEYGLRVVFHDGRVARAPRLAVAKDAVEPNFDLPQPSHTDCADSFDANDFNLPTTIARIVVVQNLSRLEHYASLPLGCQLRAAAPRSNERAKRSALNLEARPNVMVRLIAPSRKVSLSKIVHSIE